MSKQTQWYLYNNALLPDVPPHEEVKSDELRIGDIWNGVGRRAFFARWTSEFDCDCETSWWYVIKDTPFDINNIKSKRRYEINKGKRCFEVRTISSDEHIDELYDIQVAAYSVYPKKYRPHIQKETWIASFLKNSRKANTFLFAAFDKNDDSVSGYALLTIQDVCINFVSLKVQPEKERFGINAAIVSSVLEYFDERLRNGYYICDGERNIQHETAFQDYLEKYFCFRKAYCRLNIKYNPRIEWMINFLYCFKNLLKHFSKVRLIHKVNGVLMMEEIFRHQK